ncbi:MAG: glycosyltransferase family 1 protein [Microbacterium sp.]|uniref:glycosyltransferase family 4 protein n=1 Tax=Microbacterium sp. TaxID=51671 RepID=UPI0039E3EBA0
MKILMPSRILDRHTGGNTTYARAIASGLTSRGISVGKIPMGSHPAITLLRETEAGLRAGEAGDVLHYVADTGPLIKTRRPSVVTVHGVASRWISDARNRRQEKIWRTRVQRAIDSTDRVITVSRSSARDIHEVFGVDASRIVTIEHGIDLDRFSTPTPLSEEINGRLPNEFALYLGNIEPRKNLVPLIEAFERPEVRELGIPLVIAGKPAWNSETTLARLAEATNAIQLGFVSDQDRTALMQAASVFLFPSLYEGFGFPVLEALAAGTIVMTSDRGSLADIAGPSLQFPSLTADGITEGVVRALTDQTARGICARNGRDWASQFSWEASVSKHVDVYESML